MYASTGTTASTAAQSAAAVGGTGNLLEAQDTRTNDGGIGVTTVSVDAADSDVLTELSGNFTTNATGDFRIQLAAETAGLVVRAAAGSSLRLRRLTP